MLSKKYNKSRINVTAWTTVEDTEYADGFEIKQKINGDTNVILNALQAIVAQIMYDTIDAEDIEASIGIFRKGVLKNIEKLKEEWI